MRAGVNSLTVTLLVGVAIGLGLTPDGRAWLREPTLLLGSTANASASPSDPAPIAPLAAVLPGAVSVPPVVTPVVTPLTFLGGSFYSINMLPEFWQKVTLFNPVVYLVSGFRWAFFERSDVSVATSLGMTALFLVLCLGGIWWIFKTGYRVKQ